MEFAGATARPPQTFGPDEAAKSVMLVFRRLAANVTPLPRHAFVIGLAVYLGNFAEHVTAMGRPTNINRGSAS
jgi:hypothetical protein